MASIAATSRQISLPVGIMYSHWAYDNSLVVFDTLCCAVVDGGQNNCLSDSRETHETVVYICTWIFKIPTSHTTVEEKNEYILSVVKYGIARGTATVYV